MDVPPGVREVHYAREANNVDFSVLNTFPSETIFNIHSRRVVDSRHGRTIFVDEPHCFNCEGYDHCWARDEQSNIERMMHSMPREFSLRTRTNKTEWSYEKFLLYIQSIFASHCAVFVPRDAEERQRRERESAKREANRLEQERIAKQKELGFDA